MRLVQQGRRAEAEMLLARGDCNLDAQAANTGAWWGLVVPSSLQPVRASARLLKLSLSSKQDRGALLCWYCLRHAVAA